MGSVFQALAALGCCALVALGLVGERQIDRAAPDPSEVGGDQRTVQADFMGDETTPFSETVSQSEAEGWEPDPPEHAPGADTLYRMCRVTAYCDRGQTASGVQSGVGQCAAPADIPFGAEIYIPALGRTFVVTDRTHERFRRSTVDIFLPGKAECWKFGRQYLECEITSPG